MSLPRFAAVVAGLWVAARVVGGIRIGEGPGPLAMLGSLAVVALGYVVGSALTTRLRHRVWLLSTAPVPAVGSLLLLNGLVLWVVMVLAGTAGLPVQVTGFLPALCASLLVPIVSGTLLTLLRGPQGRI